MNNSTISGKYQYLLAWFLEGDGNDQPYLTREMAEAEWRAQRYFEIAYDFLSPLLLEDGGDHLVDITNVASCLADHWLDLTSAGAPVLDETPRVEQRRTVLTPARLADLQANAEAFKARSAKPGAHVGK